MHTQEQKPQALIFDMDGTLFQTETLVVPAYHKAFARLQSEGLIEGEEPPVSILLSSLGMLLPEIWARVMPHATLQARERMDVLLLEEQLILLEQGVGELYPETASTLRRMHDGGYRLFVASNGLEHYVKGVAKYLGIAPLFEGLYSAGEYETETKVELVRLLLEKHQITSAWMVGDRSSDVEAGLGNGLRVIGCEYAEFGVQGDELKGAHERIRTFGELAGLLGL